MGCSLCWNLWTLFVLASVNASTASDFDGAVGGSVFMFTSLSVPGRHKITWEADTTLIATIEDGQNPVYYPTYNSRCELFSNATLRLDGLLPSDSKNYKQSIENKNTGVTSSVTVTLEVHNLLTPPDLTADPATRPVQGDNITLYCNAGSQIVNTYTFLRDDESISCSEPHISCNTSSPFLNFHPITENDNGSYTCVIYNPVSSNISNLVIQDVAVRVSNVALHNNASRPVTVEKDSVALQCSSRGTDVSYTWTLRESALPANPRYHLINNDATLIISPVSREDQGYFTCTVSNYLNNETSPNLTLSWAPDGQIACGAMRLGDHIELSCSWPGGYPAANLHLKFADMEALGEDKVTGNVPLTHPASILTCEGSQGWTQSCSLIIDTPKSSGLANDTLVEGDWGKKAILSVPLTYENRKENIIGPQQLLPATFTWYRLTPKPEPLPLGENFTVISNDYISYLVVSSVTSDATGQYMCTAENLIGSTNFYFTLRIPEVNGPSGVNLSPGALAGIVIGAIAAGSLITGVIALLLNKQGSGRKPQKSPDMPKVSREPNQNPYQNNPVNTTRATHMDNPAFDQSRNSSGIYTNLEPQDNDLYQSIEGPQLFRNRPSMVSESLYKNEQ
ncbi:hypothetical protein XENTR_v10019219 [Xenopus tropicalis]|uniref:Carcinoembryonic antigen-related cell adhesion molecule 1-like n=1 Tax=Xenopus tropicalis TaxID=8364 RepID=A0A803JTZ0_XENTR|nr:carcinoembryonic antigen-related cell adhesion molecule 1-like [Xenopus tropicalis]KAE8593611.1 hypothetical protein XENTR_v10019219 [Xenopus tropicalis]